MPQSGTVDLKAEISALKVVIAVYIADNAKLGREADSLAATIERQTAEIRECHRRIDERHGYAQCNAVKDELGAKIRELKNQLLVENEKFHAQSRLRYEKEQEIVELKKESQDWRDQCYKRLEESQRWEKMCGDKAHALENAIQETCHCGERVREHTCPEAVSKLMNSHLLETMWRPIATAPKDKSLIFAWVNAPGQGFRSAIVRWVNEKWVEQEGSIYFREVTHWMPLTKKLPI